MKQVADFAYLTEQIAFLCGLWNGLVDFGAGIFKFLGILLQAPYDMADNFQNVLEAIDDFRDAWAAFSFKDFFITGMRLHADILAELIQFFTDPNPRENYNFDVIAYYSGFGVAFIASFFIPAVNIAKVSSIAKFSKFIPEEFVATLNVARTQGVKGFKAMVRLLEDIAEFLGRKGDELYQELKKLLDKLLAWIKTNKQRFEVKKISKSNYNELYQLYGKFIAKGSSRIKRKYVSEYRKIIREADSYSVRKQFEKDLARKKPKPKNPKIYLQRRKQAYINFEKGNAFERIFLKTEGGVKPNNSIKTALTNRFPDNIKNGVSRELKSGYIKHTKRFEKQFKKDIDILSRRLDDDILKIEWHIIEGIDESALKFMQETAKESNVLDKTTIILY